VDEAWKDDLPERFGPMTVKELRQNLRRASFVYPVLGIQALAVVTMVAEFRIGSTSNPLKEYAGMLNFGLLGTSGPFWAVVGMVCLGIMPLAGLVLMGQELEEGNHELLLLTHLSRWKVVLGKFLTLWGLCALTFVSLLPYVVVRYLVGGIEWSLEAACSATVLGGSAVIAAGAIGASSFHGLGARVAAIALFLASMIAACSVPLFASAAQEKGCGVWYHLNAFAAVACYVTMGLALARSRLRLVVHAYEVKPSWMVIGLLIFTPFIVWMTTAFTLGYAGAVGLIGMTLVAIYADITPKAPKWVTAPLPDVPT
jgi:ABC-type transport system involved in multi-copper enzyme maturation permease subunit